MTHTLRASRMTHTLFKQADTCRCNNVATHTLPPSFLHFLFSFPPPPHGQGWGSLGPHGQIQPETPSKFHRTVSSRPAGRASICIGGHIPDTCSTHTRHMLNTCLASRRCVGDAWRCGERLRLRFIARIKAQHG